MSLVWLRLMSWLFFALQAIDAQSCIHAKKTYSDGSLVKMDEPCLSCSCTRGQLVCHLRMCSILPDIRRKGCRVEKLSGKCCPKITCDSNSTSSGFGKFLRSNQIGRNEDSVVESDILPPSRDNRIHKIGCKVDESFFADGSALPSSIQCTHCYCLKGNVSCIRPKCHLNITGCQPLYSHAFACCPTHYDCTFFGITQIAEQVTKPTIDKKVCYWKNHRYQDGTRIPTDNPCRSCFCVRGLVKCTTQECAPAVKGCIPIRQKGFCCPLDYMCEEDTLNSTSSTNKNTTNYNVFSSKIRENDRVIDFPFDQLGNDYQLVKRTSSAIRNGRTPRVKELSLTKVPLEFKAEDDEQRAKSHREPRKSVRSATSRYHFAPRSNNRKVLFSKRQRSSTTTASSDIPSTVSKANDNLESTTLLIETDNTKTYKESTLIPITKSVTKSVRNGVRNGKKTTIDSFKNEKVSESATPLVSAMHLNQEIIDINPKRKGYHVINAEDGYNDGFDGFHEESAFNDEWPVLAANVYDYFKQESHEESEINEDSVKNTNNETDEKKPNGDKEDINAAINGKVPNVVQITTTKPTIVTIITTDISTEKVPERKLLTTRKVITDRITTTLSSSTMSSLEPTIKVSKNEDINTENQKTNTESAITESEPKTIFLKRVGLNFQVNHQKSSEGNQTFKFPYERHRAPDASTKFSKIGTATIEKLSQHEGRKISNVQTSRSEKEGLTDEFSLNDEIDFPVSADSLAFQVIPFLPEDAVFNDQQSSINKTWQSLSPLHATTNKSNSPNKLNKTNRFNQITPTLKLHIETTSKPVSEDHTQSHLTRWIPIRQEDATTPNKTSLESKEDESPTLLTNLFSLFGFTGLNGAKKIDQTQNPITPSTLLPQYLVTQESNGWLPLRHGNEDGFTKTNFQNQPLSTSGLQKLSPNATSNLFLIGQPKEEIISVDNDDLIRKDTKTTTEPILKLILSHIHNSTETDVKNLTTPKIAEESTTLRLRHASVTEKTTLTSIDDSTPTSYIYDAESIKSNTMKNDLINITTSPVPEKTTIINLWEVFNLFKQDTDKTTAVNDETELPISVGGNDNSYYYYNEENKASNTSIGQSSVDLNDNFRDSLNADEIEIPENETAGVYNPFIFQVKGCDIYGKYYNLGEIIKELSSSCKQCLCSGFGVDCNRLC